MIAGMMIRCLPMAVLPCLLVACAAPPPGELGRRYAATIPGTWRGIIHQGDTETRTIYHCRPDGTAEAVSMQRKKEAGATLVLAEIPHTFRWRVVGDEVEYSQHRTRGGRKPQHDISRDTIISVSRDRIVTRGQREGTTEVLTRVELGR